MAKQRVLVVGGGLAGLAAAMKLAEGGVDVDVMSLTPVKRSHSRRLSRSTSVRRDAV